jgi:hypothetical protein
VSGWESDKQPIGHHTDLLLRAMVALDRKVDEYPIAAFAEVKAEATERPRHAFRPSAKKWKPTELSAA